MDDPDVRREYWLSGDVYCCEVGEGAILLDLARERYLGIATPAAAVLRGMVRNWPKEGIPITGIATREEENCVAQTLLREGLLVDRAPRTRLCGPDVGASRSAAHMVETSQIHASVPAAVCVRFAAAYTVAGIFNATCSMRRTIERLRERRIETTVPASDEQIIRLLAHFSKLRALTYTASYRCVLDSLVLSEFLTRSGISSTFIIGVKTRSFGAHCWVQAKDIVLNDTVEHSGSYEPILVV